MFSLGDLTAACAMPSEKVKLLLHAEDNAQGTELGEEEEEQSGGEESSGEEEPSEQEQSEDVTKVEEVGSYLDDNQLTLLKRLR
eukprot:TRINITY_DN15706_c0_g1_i1.p2 TRINITY_DN15706_c0_g1~~TRINITY_DN15706_c0_g1_i1.p2  ORF type:complete len:84 (+),score=21.14 TRINITY_DN15706_c0_g1_i1:334-585(+)